jgi:cytoskeletal protein CcmA (bactofilin family)
MFGKKEEVGLQGRSDSLIAAGMRVEGNVIFSGILKVEGEVKGSVSAAEAASVSQLILGEYGRIEGDVRVAQLVTNGQIVGAVTVLDSLEMQPKAKIVGDVEYASIEMHQGAVIDAGKLLFRARVGEQNVGSSD